MESATCKHLDLAIRIYEGAWRIATPFLRRNQRLQDGFSQRQLDAPLPPADLWIQAASGGEAYLAVELVRHLRPQKTVHVLLTTNTRQGKEILEKAAAHPDPKVVVSVAFFPFDRPTTMARAVHQVNPKAVVLLETEIWPGLLYALKTAGRPIYLINGRMTEKSLSRYSKLPKLFYALRPDKVLAISDADARRFENLFGADTVSVMSNIKFDRLPVRGAESDQRREQLISDHVPFLVLGSVREEEEPQVEKMIGRIHTHCPDAVIGLFPRHMHRLDHWKKILNQSGTPWSLRSAAQPPVRVGQVLLWDTFGELADAYAAATAVFVGGSLAPLGGQNFLEPLIHGTVPVIGPSYENFAWIGEDIFDKQLVIRAADWIEAADCLISRIKHPGDRENARSEALRFIRSRQGGTLQACRLIRPALGLAPEPDFPEAGL